MATVLAYAATSLTSCGGTQDDDVADVATAFASALEVGDGARACSVLAHSTRSELEQSTGDPCEEAILDETVQPVGAEIDVEAYGTMARARFAEDTFFLTRFETGCVSWPLRALLGRPSTATTAR